MLHLTPQEKRVLWLGLGVILAGCLVRAVTIYWVLPKPQAITHPRVSLPKLIRINEADYKALDTLPGVGKTLAFRILDYRKTHGPFTSIDQLKKIKGLTDKVYRQIYFRLEV